MKSDVFTIWDLLTTLEKMRADFKAKVREGGGHAARPSERSCLVDRPESFFSCLPCALSFSCPIQVQSPPALLVIDSLAGVVATVSGAFAGGGRGFSVMMLLQRAIKSLACEYNIAVMVRHTNSSRSRCWTEAVAWLDFSRVPSPSAVPLSFPLRPPTTPSARAALESTQTS